MVIYFFFLYCFTAKEAYFRIQNYPYETCLYYGDINGIGFVRKDTCYDNSKYYWLWTNNGQLLNWESLKCMTDDYVTPRGTHFVVMKKCDNSNLKQLWKCERIHQNNYITLKQSHRYLCYGEYRNYVTAGHSHWLWARVWWTRYGSKQDVCSQGNLILNFTKKNKARTTYTLHDSQLNVTIQF